MGLGVYGFRGLGVRAPMQAFRRAGAAFICRVIVASPDRRFVESPIPVNLEI